MSRKTRAAGTPDQDRQAHRVQEEAARLRQQLAALEARITQLSAENQSLRSELDRQGVQDEDKVVEARTMARPGSWVWDIRRNTSTWSDELCHLFGVDPQALGVDGYDAFIQCIHPDDRQRIQKAIELTVEDRDPLDVVYRIVRPDGQVRHVHARAEVIYDQHGEPVIMAGTSQDITERAQTEQALARHAQEMAALYETSLEITAHLDLPTLLETILRRAATLLGAEMGAVYLMRPDGESLEMVLSHNLADSYVGTVLRLGEGVSGRIAQTGHPLAVEDYVRWEGRAPLFDSIPFHRVLGVPLKVGNRVLGVINITDDKMGPFGEDEVRLLSLFADQAAIAVENARLYQEAERLRRFNENIVQSMDEGILLYDEAGRISFVNPRAAEMLGWPADQLVGQSLFDHAPPEEFETIKAQMELRRKGKPSHYETVMLTRDGQRAPVLVSARPLYDETGMRDGEEGERRFTGGLVVFTDITERVRIEETLQQHNRDLELLNQAGQALNSSLDLDRVLATVLEEVRRAWNVAACSIWLVEDEDRGSGLICRQASGPGSEMARGWRLAPGEGIAGWVVDHGESLVVADVEADGRFVVELGQVMDLRVRSALSVPLRASTPGVQRAREEVIGVLHVVDTQVGRFTAADLTLMESLAATAAIAIENARLYEQARRDAQAKSVLLREVNHRVKNNLAVLVSLLYAEQEYAEVAGNAAYQTTMQDLINRVQGLSTVHSLLSASEWGPLQLTELATQIMSFALRSVPLTKRVALQVYPSDLRVTPDQARDLALVINELSTNAVRHALGDQDTLRISVYIDREDDRIRFEFRDNGPGYPEAVLRSERWNVGFELIHSLVTGGLSGDVALNNDDGAVAVVRFPLEV
jgi:PAS domain S-box-containing protein